MIVGRNLDGYYWRLSGEVQDVGQQVCPEGGDSKTGVCFGKTLGGGALKVDLGSRWSDSGNCGCSGGSNVTEEVDYYGTSVTLGFSHRYFLRVVGMV